MKKHLIPLLLIFATAIPIIALFYSEFRSFPAVINILVTGGAIGIFASALYLLYSTSRLSTMQLTITALSAGFGIFICSTIITLRQSGALIAIGKMLLAGWAFSGIALYLIHYFRDFTIPTRLVNILTFLRGKWLIALFLLTILPLAYWSHSRSTSLYFWDTRTYWAKVENFYDSLHSGNWKKVIRQVADSYSDDYGSLAALPPAIFNLFTGYPTTLRYLIAIIVIYAIPAYFIVAYLGSQLCGTTPKQNAWILTSIPIFLGLPLYFEPLLNLMLDIGGSVLYVCALLYADKLLQLIIGKHPNSTAPLSHNLITLSLGLGLFLSLMFLFRRWYVFASASILLSGAIIASVQLWIHRKDWKVILRRASLSVVLISFAAIPFLAPILFDWSHNIEAHNYVKLYASFKRTLFHDAIYFINNFGIVLPLFSIIAIIALYVLNQNRQLLLLLVGSSLFNILLFLQVQSPSQHHFYLLMPFFGASIAAACMLLYRSYGWAVPCGLSIIILSGGLLSTSLPQSLFGTLFANYHNWLPREQPYIKPLKEIGQWLIAPETKDKKFIFLRSPGICGGMIKELWQLFPTITHREFADRFVTLDGLGNPDEEARRQLNKCDIALISTHLKESDPVNGYILQQDLITGAGIGAAFKATATTFSVNENTSFLVYQRLREVSREEYLDYAARCLESKRPDNIRLRGY